MRCVWGGAGFAVAEGAVRGNRGDVALAARCEVLSRQGIVPAGANRSDAALPHRSEALSLPAVTPAKAGIHFDFAVASAVAVATSEDPPQSRASVRKRPGHFLCLAKESNQRKALFLFSNQEPLRLDTGAGPRDKGHPGPVPRARIHARALRGYGATASALRRAKQRQKQRQRQRQKQRQRRRKWIPAFAGRTGGAWLRMRRRGHR